MAGGRGTEELSLKKETREASIFRVRALRAIARGSRVRG